MSGEVIKFPKEPLIWICACGCKTFYLQDDHQVICAHCEHPSCDHHGDWRSKLPEAPENPEPAPDKCVTVTDLGAPEVAIRHILKAVVPEQIQALVILEKDGTLRTWGWDVKTKKRLAWMKRRFRDAADLIFFHYNQKKHQGDATGD